jgi:hypothetical protein
MVAWDDSLPTPHAQQRLYPLLRYGWPLPAVDVNAARRRHIIRTARSLGNGLTPETALSHPRHIRNGLYSQPPRFTTSARFDACSSSRTVDTSETTSAPHAQALLASLLALFAVWRSHY